MKKLLNTLYVTTADAYLSLEGERVVVFKDDKQVSYAPLHNLDNIITFGYTGASPALMAKCAKNGITLSFFNEYGRYMASVVGETTGNVLLRRAQYRAADNEKQTVGIVRNILTGKLHNSRWVLERATRDYPVRLDVSRIKTASKQIYELINETRSTASYGEMLGIEGNAAAKYFSVFDEMILQNKESFFFKDRNRQPPLDNVNSMLSFMYSLLANDVSSALTAVGLDPFVGFLHKDRPGRRSLAFDIMEEFRAPLSDRFVLTMINTRQINCEGFKQMENGAVEIKNETRKIILSAWHMRKKETVEHHFINEKVEWGLIPHIQASLLARYLRGDLDEYPPFLWK